MFASSVARSHTPMMLYRERDVGSDLRGNTDDRNLYACAVIDALTTPDPRRIQEMAAPVSARSISRSGCVALATRLVAQFF
jgi:hypothetical protein